MGIEDAEDDDGAVVLDGKMDGIGEGIDGFNPDVAMADGNGVEERKSWVMGVPADRLVR